MRKRSKYKPKPVLLDPLGFVVESANPLKDHDSYVLDWRLKNNLAFQSLLRAEASIGDLNTLVAATNIVEALLVVCKLPDPEGTVARSSVALMDICARANVGKGTATKAAEQQALRDMMVLHDELLENVTVRQFESALLWARKEIKAGRADKIKAI